MMKLNLAAQSWGANENGSVTESADRGSKMQTPGLHSGSGAKKNKGSQLQPQSYFLGFVTKTELQETCNNQIET